MQNSQTILDLASGTGTLSIGIKRRFPETKVFCIDIDEEILQMAQKKAQLNGFKINFGKGFSDELPFSNETFDRVFSTLFFHHLTLERKIKTLQEILRVLKTGGEFHLADYGLAKNKTQFALSKFVRVIDGFESTNDNLHGRLKLLMEQNGFAKVERTRYFKTVLGTIRLFKATKENNYKG